MFRKPKRNFRSRKHDSDSEDERTDGEDGPLISTPSNVESAKKVPKKPKEKTIKKSSSATSVLSFDEEVDSEAFQIKRSSHSRRVARQLKKEHKKEKEEEEKKKDDNIIGSGRHYSTNSLKELKTEQELNNGVAPVDMELGSDVELSPRRLGRSDETKDGSVDSGENGRSSVEGEEEGDSEDSLTKDTISKDSVKNVLDRGVIPDAAMIHLARKRRQQARERGEEFISLENNGRVEKPGSRLIREEDHDHSDEDERTNFTVNQREQELRRMQDMIQEAEEGSHSEGSDQEREWEEQQIRKGVKAAGPTNCDDTSHHAALYGGQQPPSGITGPGFGSDSPGSGYIVASNSTPPSNLPTVAIEHITKRLKDRLSDMADVHRAHIHERDDIESRLESCQSDITNHGTRKKGLEERYRFFQEMRGYVRDLVECLSEKMNSIVYLERCMNNLLKQRNDKLVKRRQEDIKDQSMDYVSGKATPADFSDDMDRQRRVAEREARRARRKRKRMAFGDKDHHDGMSTDDEENNSEMTKFNTERDRITGDVNTLFDDVVDDFARLDSIKARFEEWRTLQGDSYSEAYIGLCLPKLFTPIVRAQLITWNPLAASSPNFEELPWYESLMFYGYEEGQPAAKDCDLKILPSIVDKVLIPKISGLVETAWDPMSASETKALVTVVRQLFDDYPLVLPDNKNTQVLMRAIVERIKKTLGDDVFMPLYPKQVLENRSSKPAIFFHRQFWTQIKLFQNILLFHGILGNKPLLELSLGGLLNRYLVLALQNSAVTRDSITRCQAITSSLPKAWFSGLQADSTIPQLEHLCRYLVTSANNLNSVACTGKDGEKQEARECIKQIRKMLVFIHALDHATSLADLTCLQT